MGDIWQGCTTRARTHKNDDSQRRVLRAHGLQRERVVEDRARGAVVAVPGARFCAKHGADVDQPDLIWVMMMRDEEGGNG